MSIFMPFNFNPTSFDSGAGSATTYTVPADHYAFVEVTLIAGINYTEKHADGFGNVAQSSTVTGSCWLKDGDVLLASTFTDGTTSVITPENDSAITTVSINGNVAFRAKAAAHFVLGSTATKFKYFDVTWRATEYAIP